MIIDSQRRSNTVTLLKSRSFSVLRMSLQARLEQVGGSFKLQAVFRWRKLERRLRNEDSDPAEIQMSP
jgi:hypothetical protein